MSNGWFFGNDSVHCLQRMLINASISRFSIAGGDARLIGRLLRRRQFNVNRLGFTLAQVESCRAISHDGQEFRVAGLAVLEALDRYHEVLLRAGERSHA